MNLNQPSGEPIKFMSSVDSDVPQDQDLLFVTYTRVQKDSPEFTSVFEGIDQKVEVRISTFIFRAAPEPVIALYDFIMTTFVPQANNLVLPAEQAMSDVQKEQTLANDSSKIYVTVNLASVQGPFTFERTNSADIIIVILMNGPASLATLSLSTADVAVLVLAKALRVSGKLGSLSLTNDADVYDVSHDFGQILSIEGQNLAEFRYQTYDPDEAGYNGIKSTVSLTTASLKLHFLEQPLHDIYLFLVKFARLKGLYDAATQAAVQSAPEMDRMQFEVSVKSPIVVFPFDPVTSRDTLVLRLGEITASNSSKADKNKMTAGLHGIQLVSNIHYDEALSTLKIIDDINVAADIVQVVGVDRSQIYDVPDTQVWSHT